MGQCEAIKDISNRKRAVPMRMGSQKMIAKTQRKKVTAASA